MKILFICTANSCRSILSEALFNHIAPEGQRAYSAGSFPSGQLNQQALATLQAAGVATAGLSSKGNEAHVALNPDVVISVCDKAAGEPCPVYFGPALKAHWGLVDPSAVQGDAEQVAQAFADCVAHIRKRLDAWLAAQPWTLSRDQQQAVLAQIGEL
ncbi:arsenate reductase ArsC [Pseudomonas sp. 5P_3.1_Bac2]|uniref:arsenate reductase ArsC n=1 Tax=Pseudomonas sp. 5P_3.1_Bac2 TaxID=2971617 RepID=UPI0021CA6664|nr:arsenate reductase ArsC [Pseudomonas sp. 5P_3.1_Bac2]MCU1715737.1 arsenate reductase ArsC [Pseudomonas sp. 5P_3.1_Bac2]